MWFSAGLRGDGEKGCGLVLGLRGDGEKGCGLVLG